MIDRARLMTRSKVTEATGQAAHTDDPEALPVVEHRSGTVQVRGVSLARKTGLPVGFQTFYDECGFSRGPALL